MSKEGTGRGELVTESSAEVTGMLRDRFRKASVVFATPGMLLMLIGLVLWLVVGAPWFLWIVFFAFAGALFLYSAMLLAVASGLPSLRIYEGGVMLKPPKGRTRFIPWRDFMGYRERKMGELEAVELVMDRGEPITIPKLIPEWKRVEGLLRENLEELD